MTPHFDAIVIGAGQAGLATGHYLAKTGLRFLLLDGAPEIGESWRRRWDSLRLFTPARYSSLPGLSFPGDQRALPTKDEVAAYLKAYAEHFALPIQLNARVSAVERNGIGYIVRNERGDLTASTVIVATGAYHRPFIPAFASELASDIVQLHSNHYRNPEQLPPGDARVVGADNSGAQIAIELSSTRKVWLSGRRTGAVPRRLLGRDIYDWLWPTLLRPNIDSRLGRRLMAGRLLAGDPLIGITERDLTRATLARLGWTVGVRDGLPLLEDGQIRKVSAIIWCTGFRPDFSWIRLPILDTDGYPTHLRGLATYAPGLAFVGLRYQYRIGSSLLGGVGEDAEYVVAALNSVACRAA